MTLAAMVTGATLSAAPLTYFVDVDYNATDYFCVGCGGANTIFPDHGGTLDGTVTFDADLTGASRLVAFDLTGFVPEEPSTYTAGPGRSFNYTYDSTQSGFIVSNSSGDLFSIWNTTDLAANGSGWNSFLSIDVQDGLGTEELTISFAETIHLRGLVDAYFGIYRNDRRARNMDQTVLASTAAPVPLPASGLLLLAGVGAAAALRKRRG